jgi:hypothetical protein
MAAVSYLKMHAYILVLSPSMPTGFAQAHLDACTVQKLRITRCTSSVKCCSVWMIPQRLNVGTSLIDCSALFRRKDICSIKIKSDDSFLQTHSKPGGLLGLLVRKDFAHKAVEGIQGKPLGLPSVPISRNFGASSVSLCWHCLFHRSQLSCTISCITVRSARGRMGPAGFLEFLAGQQGHCDDVFYQAIMMMCVRDWCCRIVTRSQIGQCGSRRQRVRRAGSSCRPTLFAVGAGPKRRRRARARSGGCR